MIPLEFYGLPILSGDPRGSSLIVDIPKVGDRYSNWANDDFQGFKSLTLPSPWRFSPQNYIKLQGCSGKFWADTQPMSESEARISLFVFHRQQQYFIINMALSFGESLCKIYRRI